MTITDDTKLVEVKGEEDLCIAVKILAGVALLENNRRLYEHLYHAVQQYKLGVDLGWSKL